VFGELIPLLKILFFRHRYTNLKNSHINRFCIVIPIVSSKYRKLCQFCYVKIFSTNEHRNLLLLDNPGRVRSQIINVVCQIQRFDFECNLVLTRKLIIRIPPGLGLNPRSPTRGTCMSYSRVCVRYY
jgi:hypothetical protein